MNNFFLCFGAVVATVLCAFFILVAITFFVTLVRQLYEMARNKMILRALRKVYARQIAEITRLSLDNLYNLGVGKDKSLGDIEQSLEKYKDRIEIK